MSNLRRLGTSFTITQLCREFGVTTRALRFYEEKGLLAPSRNRNERVYTYRDRARLQLILDGKRVGLSLDDIREILDLHRRDAHNQAQKRRALEKFNAQLVVMQEKRAEIDQAITALEAASGWLSAQVKALEDDSQAVPDHPVVQPTRLRG